MGISRPARFRASRFALTLVAALISGQAAAEPAPPASASDPPAIETLRATIQRHVAALGDGQRPPRTRACKTNSEGVCVYREKKKMKERSALTSSGGADTSEYSRAPTPEERALIAAYEAYLAHPAAADASDRDAARYHLAQLLVETGGVEAALAHLTALTETAASPELAAWAAALLVDALVIQWNLAADLESSRHSTRRLREQLERLESLPLWRHEAARPLREMAPRLAAGIRWREGFAHLERGRDARDLDARSEAFLACADAFLALHADHGAAHDKADTLLWNAARCLEAALDPLAAAAQYARLVELYPDSAHTREATLYVAEIYVAQARYARAVEWYERFAARFAKDRRAPEALAAAVEFRAALGPKDALQAALAAYESLYARKDPKRAATIFWSGYALLAADARSRRAYADRYLKVFGHRGGVGREVIAQVALADALSSITCPLKQTEAGLCVAVSDGEEVGLRFTDSPVVGRHQLHTRKLRRRLNADAEASLAGFRRALDTLDRVRLDVPPEDTRQLRDLAYASARAWLALADALFETLLDGSNPALAARPPKAPDPRASPWRSDTRSARGHEAASIADDARLSVIAGVGDPLAEVIDRLDRAYASLEEGHVGTPAAATASARRGQLREWLMDHVLAGETSPRRPCEHRGRRRSLCTTTKGRYDALHAASRDAYARCVAQMRDGAVPEETAALCLRRLVILDPTSPARLPELFGTAGPYDAEEPAALADRAGVVTDYEAACSAAQPATPTTDAE